MAIKFEKITPGMVLLDIHSHRMGSITMRTLGCWNIHVISVDLKKRTVVASWNSNTPKTYSEREITRYYTKPTKAYRDQQARKGM